MPDGALSICLPDALIEALAKRVGERLSLSPERDDGFLDVRGAAEYLSLSEEAIRSKIRRGELPVYRRGGRVFLDRAELRAWVVGASGAFNGEEPRGRWESLVNRPARLPQLGRRDDTGSSS